MNAKHICATCAYWKKNQFRGQCRREAPGVMQQDFLEPQGFWVETRPGDWCGEHSAERDRVARLHGGATPRAAVRPVAPLVEPPVEQPIEQPRYVAQIAYEATCVVLQFAGVTFSRRGMSCALSLETVEKVAAEVAKYDLVGLHVETKKGRKVSPMLARRWTEDEIAAVADRWRRNDMRRMSAHPDRTPVRPFVRLLNADGVDVLPEQHGADMTWSAPENADTGDE